MGDYHVRFCERLGVKFPLSTRQKLVVNNAEEMNVNTKIKPEDKCYWCGNQAVGFEHVPPQNLFPKGYRNELIKVSACKKHNQDLSKIDERMRINIIMLSHTSKVARILFNEKILTGIQREESKGLGIDIANNIFEKPEGGGYIRLNSKHSHVYIEKIIRGLYFHIYGDQFLGSTHHFWYGFNDLSLSANAHFYYFELEKKYSKNWIAGNSKNKEVFDYKYYYCNVEKQFFVIMNFYEIHKVIGISIPEGKNIENYGLDIDKYLNIKLE